MADESFPQPGVSPYVLLMPVHRGITSELPGLARACAALAAGEAVVVPNPPPMAYGVVATSAWKVNAVKGRPHDQNVAVSLHDRSERRRVLPSIDLPAAAVQGVIALLDRRLTVLLPLRTDVPCPGWVFSAVRGGELAAFNGCWDATATVWEQFPRLYGSSANRTGEAPAGSARDARAALGGHCVVIEGDGLGDRSRASASSTMVRLDRHGRLILYRSGAHDQAWKHRPAAYVRHLADMVGLSAGGVTGEPQ
jgi:tRNA A37 threonylcarbamoyladenosine synthetase subunit TsaC/SUA5/YrdC